MSEKSPYSREGEETKLEDKISSAIGKGNDHWLIDTPTDMLGHWSPNDVARKYQTPAVMALVADEIAAKDATIAEQAERIAKLEARLEIDHVFQWKGDGEEPVRVEIAMEDRDTIPDGITARDSTIKLQDEALSRKDARISELEQTVAKAFLRVQELEAAVKPFADAAESVCGLCHDSIPLPVCEVVLYAADYRRARSASYGEVFPDGRKNPLCHEPSGRAETKGSAQ